MAPLPHSCSFTKVLLVLGLVFVLFIPVHSDEIQPQNNHLKSRRMMELVNKKTSLSPSKNQTKLLKSTKQIKNPSVSSGFGSIKNQTKLSKSKLSLSDSQNKPSSTISFKSQLQKLNPTPSKSPNSAKITTNKSSDLPKISSTSSPKNKTTKTQVKKDTFESKSKTPKLQTGKNTKTQVKKDTFESKSKTPKLQKGENTKTQVKKDTIESKSKTPKLESVKNTKTQVKKDTTESKIKKSSSQYSWVEDDEDDLISEFKDLPSKFQETLLPDLEKISKTSKVYLNKANKEITKNFKPYVGTKYAPTIASIISFAFILIPLILVSLIFNKIKAYFSLQKLLIFIQVYLSIYFFILCLSSLITGLEPLKFFYNTAQSTYICLQLLQTLAYVLYLLMLLMYLILVFSTETGPVTKLIGLAQTFVGFAVGLHYYMTVFHRAVLHQPPKTSFKVHAIYAIFFLVICLSSSADTRKKAYLVQGDEVEKKS